MTVNTKHNPDKHHRRSIRLCGYDYAQEGLYFVTVCCQGRACLFGEIVDGEMILNPAGRMVEKCWLDIPKHFPHAVLHDYIIMPNHVHGIIELTDVVAGATNVRAKNFSPLPRQSQFRSPSKTIGSIVRGFKIGVTKWMRQNTDTFPVWQRNYYEHIIRNAESYGNIAEYIITNPARWQDDNLCIRINT